MLATTYFTGLRFHVPLSESLEEAFSYRTTKAGHLCKDLCLKRKKGKKKSPSSIITWANCSFRLSAPSDRFRGVVAAFDYKNDRVKQSPCGWQRSLRFRKGRVRSRRRTQRQFLQYRPSRHRRRSAHTPLSGWMVEERIWVRWGHLRLHLKWLFDLL